MPVYFIQAGEEAIKIGWGKEPLKRLAGIQVHNHLPVRLLGTIPGDQATEREMHARFAAYRLRGEWFQLAPPLLAFIAESTDRAPERRPSMSWLEKRDDAGLRAVLQTAGGVHQLAKALGITPSSVAQWDRVPVTRVARVSDLTGVRCSVIRPDFWRPEDDLENWSAA